MLNPKAISRFWGRVEKRGPDECWPWRGRLSGKGYGRMEINKRRIMATHVALNLDGRPRPSGGHFACHTCDNPRCVNPGHLWWGTPADNMNDMRAKGRQPVMKHRGEANPNARLSAEQAAEIRRLRGKVPQSALAARYGVHVTAISKIHRGVTWGEQQ